MHRDAGAVSGAPQAKRRNSLKDVDVLLIKPSTPLVMEGLDAAFTVHRLFERSDPNAWLAENGSKIRGVVSGGSFELDRSLMEKLPNLELISNFGVGYDAVDVAAAASRGIVVTHTRTVLDDDVADIAIALVLMARRNLGHAERYARSGAWEHHGAFPLARHKMKGSALGIIGLGRIGKEIAKRAQAFGMKILYNGRHSQEDQPFQYYANLLEMAAVADVLLNCAPGGEETYHLIDTDVLKALGPDGVLVNIGRGSAVDEVALIAALKAGTIAAAGLDVFEHEPKVPETLRNLENVVLLPHVGSATLPTRNAMGQLVIDNLVSWFGEGRALTPVPETPVDRRVSH